MGIPVRLFFGYFLIVGLAAIFVNNSFIKETRPGIRQATEESLVDSANLLAELVASDLAENRLDNGRFVTAVQTALQRKPDASIYGIHKNSIDLRIYLTNARGMVIYDSRHEATGQDFSRWLDISRVLRGEYGARQTRTNPDNPASSVMHVAAPVYHNGELVGVISLAKPMTSIVPFVERATARVKTSGLILLVSSGLIGLFFTFWLGHSIHRLRDYARKVSEGRKAEPPTGGGRQLSELAQALAGMRERLEGKQYVERYVQNLAHEMKSPLTAIMGSAELLQSTLPEADRQHFVNNIGEQSARLHNIIERMLLLARVEQLQSPSEQTPVELVAMLRQLLQERELAMQSRQLHYQLEAPDTLTTQGDAFLLQQAMANLLDNAIEFSPPGGLISCSLTAKHELYQLSVHDQGAGIPEYANQRLFERFYSLPRPATGKKSTGLGLALVREVARLHGGDANLVNHAAGGCMASMNIRPRRPASH